MFPLSYVRFIRSLYALRGFDLAAMDDEAIARADELEAEIERDEVPQKQAGHWGVPLMVFEGEPFFGQDRLEILEWRLGKAGVATCS